MLPKVLVIGHNCFSKSGSNGRTLGNLFCDYPKERVAQFYIYDEFPDSEVCDNYYRVTDREALRSCFFKKVGGIVHKKDADDNSSTVATAKPSKTPLVYMIRECVWHIGRWNDRALKRWVDAFDPDVILFQAGDAAFLFRFARKISQKKKIPLIIYHSECYYFKEKNYLATSSFSDFWYKWLHRCFCAEVNRTMQAAAQAVYITDTLKKEYEQQFNCPGTTLMTAATMFFEPSAKNTNGSPMLAYLGNFGVGRCESLIELGEILHAIDDTLTIKLYGNASSDVKQKFDGAVGIKYCGFVTYEKCIEIMQNADLLVHVENFSEFYLEDSKHAFSTKIADSLASGTCLFVYAPANLACSEYLIKTQAAVVATDCQQAKNKLKELLTNEEFRNNTARRAMEVARENHSLPRISQKFAEILLDVVNKSKD